MSEYSKKDKATAKQYGIELATCMVLYIVVLFTSIYFAKSMQDTSLRTVIVMLPCIPAAGVLWTMIRNLRRLDEFVRVQFLEVLALAGGITALFSFSYGFLEGIGYPKLSGFILYGVFMGSWFVIGMIRKFLDR